MKKELTILKTTLSTQWLHKRRNALHHPFCSKPKHRLFDHLTYDLENILTTVSSVKKTHVTKPQKPSETRALHSASNLKAGNFGCQLTPSSPPSQRSKGWEINLIKTVSITTDLFFLRQRTQCAIIFWALAKYFLKCHFCWVMYSLIEGGLFFQTTDNLWTILSPQAAHHCLLSQFPLGSPWTWREDGPQGRAGHTGHCSSDWAAVPTESPALSPTVLPWQPCWWGGWIKSPSTHDTHRAAMDLWRALNTTFLP